MKHLQVGLSNEQVKLMYEKMLLARRLDERMWLLNRAGKIPFVISCQGQEGAQIGAGFAFDPSIDYVAPYYRDLGLVLQFGMTPNELMLNAFAKAADPNSGGRQMPAHYSSKKKHILTGSSPVATQIPHAVGFALAMKMKKSPAVTLVTLGEGSTNQGDFHEGLNFAAVHKLPVIVMVENNQYAISVPYDKQVACENIADRAIGYGIPGVTVNGINPINVYAVMKEAIERARNGEGPTLIEVMTTRLTAHSSDDDQRQYRSEQELQQQKEKDPIPYLAAYLLEHAICTEHELLDLDDQIKGWVNESTQFAENAPYAAPESALKYVYAEEEDM